jgi:phosphoribosylaminoimidazolecarboxamide formyltransferase / IMP cyclohydrolase
MKKIKTALISVYDKEGLIVFAQKLHSIGIKIISSGGTAKSLKENGIPVIRVTDITEFPEILGGRVKTLHPKIHGGILAVRSKSSHMDELQSLNIDCIDMVVVNLYPFEKVISDDNVKIEVALENIDIGGPTLIRGAAKCFQDVTVITEPCDYQKIIEELGANEGCVSEKTRQSLAKKAFARTASYDTTIFNYFDSLNKKDNPEYEFPKYFVNSFEKLEDLRYGENPHQKAAFYKDKSEKGLSLATSQQLAGKELSFNNIYDLDAALCLVSEFEEPAAAIIKHTNPCGCAIDDTPAKAYKKAFDSDPVSAYGGILAFNRIIDLETAELIANTTFVEACIAPNYAEDALILLKKKKNRRLLKLDNMDRIYGIPDGLAYRFILGGLLIQDRDTHDFKKEDLKFVTEIKPDESLLKSLLFAWKVCKHVKSNAILIAKDMVTAGVGAGQMSRVESTEIAIKKAGEKTIGAVLASDAMFPFADSVELAAKAGIKAVIQPGGSIRDQEVIDAANKLGIAMVFTGIRHFKH